MVGGNLSSYKMSVLQLKTLAEILDDLFFKECDGIALHSLLMEAMCIWLRLGTGRPGMLQHFVPGSISKKPVFRMMAVMAL